MSSTCCIWWLLWLMLYQPLLLIQFHEINQIKRSFKNNAIELQKYITEEGLVDNILEGEKIVTYYVK